jgi:hypothetical protein
MTLWSTAASGSSRARPDLRGPGLRTEPPPATRARRRAPHVPWHLPPTRMGRFSLQPLRITGITPDGVPLSAVRLAGSRGRTIPLLHADNC